jgi:flagellar biosynthetic protein FliQ
MLMTLKASALLTAPIIGTVLVVGIVSQVLQSVTQLKDQALSFVPKVFISGLVFTFTLPWYLRLLQEYSETIFNLIGNVSP